MDLTDYGKPTDDTQAAFLVHDVHRVDTRCDEQVLHVIMMLAIF